MLLKEEAARELARVRAQRAAEEHAKRVERERLREERRRERPLLWRGCMSLGVGPYTSTGHFEQRTLCFISCYGERDAPNDDARGRVVFEAVVADGTNKRLKPVPVSLEYLKELSSRNAYSTASSLSSQPQPGLLYDYAVKRTKGKWRGGKGASDSISTFAASTWARGCVGPTRHALPFLRLMSAPGLRSGSGSRKAKSKRLQPTHLALIPSCRFRIVRKIDRTFAILDVKVSSSPIKLSGADAERTASMTAHSQRNTKVEIVACELSLSPSRLSLCRRDPRRTLTSQPRLHHQKSLR